MPEAEGVIGPGSRVRLHFELGLLDEGAVVDSTFAGEPAEFCIGDGNLPPGFEACLVGLACGAEARFEIPPEQGFGAHNPSNLQRFRREQFSADLMLEEGLVVSFADRAGGELAGVVAELGPQFVVVDFNHPLAGRTLWFRVAVLAVEPVN